MGTWLQSHINCSSFSFFTSLFQCINFRMGTAKKLMISSPDYFAIFHYNSSNHWIRIYCSCTFFRQFNCHPHIFFINIFFHIIFLNFIQYFLSNQSFPMHQTQHQNLYFLPLFQLFLLLLRYYL